VKTTIIPTVQASAGPITDQVTGGAAVVLSPAKARRALSDCDNG
jgi:hypothetical protein